MAKYSVVVREENLMPEELMLHRLSGMDAMAIGGNRNRSDYRTIGYNRYNRRR